MSAATRNSPKFTASREQIELISKIADRAVAMAQRADVDYRKSDALLDLDACISNGCPLRLEDLLAADDFNFSHDVFGIRSHINRETGRLEDCFLPRFADLAAVA